MKLNEARTQEEWERWTTKQLNEKDNQIDLLKERVDSLESILDLIKKLTSL